MTTTPPETPEPEPKYEVYGDWLVMVVEGCTCAGGTIESSGHHEPHCGMEPLVRIDRIEELLREEADMLTLRKQVEFLADDLERPTEKNVNEPDHIKTNRHGLQYASKRLKGLLEGDKIHKGQMSGEYHFGEPPAPAMEIEIFTSPTGKTFCRVTRSGEVIFDGVGKERTRDLLG